MRIVATMKTRARGLLSDSQRREWDSLRLKRKYGDDLHQLAIACGTDKEGDSQHHYAQHYQQSFSSVRMDELNALEIGVGGYEDPRRSFRRR